MNLREYPTKIAQVMMEVHALDMQVNTLQENLKLIELEVDTKIAFDLVLKNDAQRKTRRKALLDDHPNYWECAEELRKIKNTRECASINLCKLQNEFSVMKLEYRERISKLELQLANSH